MRKTRLGKFFIVLFLSSLLLPIIVSLQSCSGSKYSTRNGGQRINSSGKVGNVKSKNRHVWGK
jgi:hypothetical protein